MNMDRSPHPPAQTLRAFVQGKLAPSDSQAIESHLADCDQCCQTLSEEPDGTLLELARDVAAERRPGIKPPVPTAVDEIPAPLLNHPRYRILEKIGSGGMGAVYKAEHRIMQRTVALKVVHPWMLAHPQAVERFHREVRVAARLTHPNIVASFDADDAGEVHFLIMEFVTGVSLDQQVKEGKPVGIAQACDWVRQAALGLQYAHEQGMVHRDIKPHNLMLTPNGVVKILDFGLTRMIQDTQLTAAANLPAHATSEGMILGTPDYIAPEQIADSRSADIRSDIYSLGCTFYFLLTGHPPFVDGTVIDKLHAHTSQGIRPLTAEQMKLPAGSPTELATQVCKIVARMTAKNPAERFSTPGEVAKALAQVQLTAKKAMQERSIAAVKGPTETAKPAVSTLGPRPVVAAVETAKRSFQPLPFSKLQLTIGGGVLATGLLLLLIWQSGLWGTFIAGGTSNLPTQPSIVPPQTTAGKQRLLLLLPSRGLWFPDYQNVVTAVKATSPAAGEPPPQLIVVGTSTKPSLLAERSIPGQAIPDLLLNSQIHAADYEALVVIGYDTSEFVPGGGFGPETSRLLGEFQTQQKPIASLCAGQRILLEHDVARGKQLAPCEFVLPAAVTNGGARIAAKSVIQDGNLITGSKDEDAQAVVQAILKFLNR